MILFKKRQGFEQVYLATSWQRKITWISLARSAASEIALPISIFVGLGVVVFELDQVVDVGLDGPGNRNDRSTVRQRVAARRGSNLGHGLKNKVSMKWSDL